MSNQNNQPLLVTAREWSFEHWQKHCRFLCKRGNLETELLLQDYVDSIKPGLAIEKYLLIEEFLSENDQDLFHWLLLTESSSIKPVKPTPNAYLALVSEIRDNYLNSKI